MNITGTIGRYGQTMLLVISILISCALPISARPYNVKFDHLSTEQGLSQNSVLSIVQDRRGFMWFGTWDGLNRYDGYNFTIYKHDPKNPKSLGSNAVWVLYEDHQGTLWAGAQLGGGLNQYDRECDQWISYRNDPNDPQSLSHNDIFALYEDHAGVLWIGTANGLNAFDRATQKFRRYSNDPDNPKSVSHNTVYAIYEDFTGTLWIGTAKGLNAYNRQTQNFTVFLPDPNDPHSISHHEIFAIYEDRSKTLWIGTTGGLNRFNRETGQFIRYRNRPNDPSSLGFNKVYTIYEDGAGNLWIGTYGGGLDLFDRDAEQFLHFQPDPETPDSLAGSVITKIYEDQTGVVWMGSEGEGVSFYDRYRIKFRHYTADPKDPNSLSNNYVRAICKDNEGIIWIGTYGGGLNRFDPVTERWTSYDTDPGDPQSLSHDVVFAVHEDRQGRLWIGTQKGLQQFDRNAEQFTSLVIPTYIRTIYEDRSGLLWIGSTLGLIRFDPGTREIEHYRADPKNPNSLSHNMVLTIHEDRQGMLWIGTYEGGINRFDRQTKQFTHYRTNPDDLNSLSHNVVTSIYEDAAGMLWIATAGGLNKLDRTQNTFTRYTEEQGLCNNTIYGLLEDREGNFWLSTNNGLSKFNPHTGQFRNYYEKDGLQSNEFNGGAYFESTDGEMFFGGIHGLNAFIPEQVQDNPFRPPIVLTNFQLFNKSVELADQATNCKSPLKKVITETQQLNLSWRDYVFSFEFAALHYSSPEENQYAYIMEGFEKEWNYVGNRRFVTYTNLPGGTYTFRVKGTNADGIWNEEGAVLSITVTSPPWKTWWAYTLYALSGIGAVLGYIRYKQLQYQRERQILDRFVPYEYLEFLGKKSILDVQLGDYISSEHMAVMFSDIRSFTRMSEMMTPKENFDFVNAYLRRVAPIIRGNHGFIVKFLGDGMMAVFPNGANDGVKAAVEKLRQVQAYNEHRIQDGWQPIQVGVGVHTGHMMVGMIGEKARIQGDAFSDNVNLTARLEGLTKYYGVSLLISGDTLKALPNPEQYHLRFLDNVAVKGKELPITIYEIFDADPEALFDKKLRMLPDFKEVQRLYFNKQFADALLLVQKVLEIIPDDLTTQLYVERCEQYLNEGVSEDWDRVHKMDKK